MTNSSMKFRSVVCGGIAVAALATMTSSAMATTANTTFTVSASIAASCQISANNLGFGSYSGTMAQVTTTVSVTCTNSTPYNVGLNAGTTTGATVTNRLMAGPGGATLAYDLYSDSGYSVNWGNTVGTDTKSGTGNGSAQTLTVYGKIPAGLYPTPGSYNDTVTATITY